jgi:hypothetical protein
MDGTADIKIGVTTMVPGREHSVAGTLFQKRDDGVPVPTGNISTQCTQCTGADRMERSHVSTEQNSLYNVGVSGCLPTQSRQ